MEPPNYFNLFFSILTFLFEEEALDKEEACVKFISKPFLLI
jgi:hypothetical protein